MTFWYLISNWTVAQFAFRTTELLFIVVRCCKSWPRRLQTSSSWFEVGLILALLKFVKNPSTKVGLGMACLRWYCSRIQHHRIYKFNTSFQSLFKIMTHCSRPIFYNWIPTYSNFVKRKGKIINFDDELMMNKLNRRKILSFIAKKTGKCWTFETVHLTMNE